MTNTVGYNGTSKVDTDTLYQVAARRIDELDERSSIVAFVRFSYDANAYNALVLWRRRSDDLFITHYVSDQGVLFEGIHLYREDHARAMRSFMVRVGSEII